MFSRKLINRSALVNLRSGNAVSGVVVFESKHALVMKGATVHTVDSEPQAADGEVLIDRMNVDFVQLL